jgi:putative tryptophan/tyrosine transport system substrate-binding protein
VKRREFLGLLGGAAVASPRVGRAQQLGSASLRKIGFLSNAPGASALNPLIAGVFAELQRLGWVDGQNVVYEPRFAAGDVERFSGFVADLVSRKVGIIVAAAGAHAVRAAQRAAPTIPVVAMADDLQGDGLVDSLAHPGSNTTGVSIFATELDAKRLELLAEMVPGARRVAALSESKSDLSVPKVAATA